MKYCASVASFGALLPSGLYSPAGHASWNPGQRAVLDVTRDQILEKPYPGFGKLAIADRLAFAAASLALRGFDSQPGETYGLALGIPYGSLSTDLRYMESAAQGFPSPALFSATLPSSPIADVAIYYGFKGPCRVLCGAEGSGIGALEQALMLLHAQKATAMLVMVIHAIDPADNSCPLIAEGCSRENRAYAFLLTSAQSEHKPRRHGLRLSIRFENPGAAQHGKPEEVYFDELLRLLSNHQTGNISFDVDTYHANMSIEKEL